MEQWQNKQNYGVDLCRDGGVDTFLVTVMAAPFDLRGSVVARSCRYTMSLRNNNKLWGGVGVGGGVQFISRDHSGYKIHTSFRSVQ